MNEKSAQLLIFVGTLGGLVAVRVKEAWSKCADYCNYMRLLVLDTAWDAPEFAILDEREKLILGGLPVSEIKANAAAYPAFSQIVVEQMENVDQLAAGAMRPTTTYAALVWKYRELESRILLSLQELGALPSDGPASIWVIGSAAKTTGRGTWLETLMGARRVVRKQGVFHPIYGVAIDSEGLLPEPLHQSRRLQGAFYRELERAALSSSNRPIPRPHDVDWTFGRPADFVFRFCGATQDGNLQSVEELTAAVSDWCTTTLLNPVVHQLVSGPKGDRARLIPNVSPTDGHPVDPRPRYFISSGVSAITLNSAAIKLYVEAERASQSLRRISGVSQPSVQNLLRELRLQYDALANEAEEVQLLARVTGRLQELKGAWDKGSLEAWPGHVQNTKHNLAKVIEQAAATVATKVARAVERLKNNIDGRIHSFLLQPHASTSQNAPLTALGLNGALALLADAIKQADAVSERATAQTGNSANLADLHRRIDEHLARLGSTFKFWNKGLRDDVMRELEAGYAHAVRTVVAQGVQDRVVEVRTWLQQRHQAVRKALGIVEQANKILEQKKAKALFTPANSRVLYLLANESEMQKVAVDANLIQPACVESATTALLEELGAKVDTLVSGLAELSPNELVEQAVARNSAVAPITADLRSYFPTAFEARFSCEEDRVAIFQWLLEKASPLGGKVDLMLEHRLPDHARPAYERNHCVLVPAKLAPKVVPTLTQLGVPATRIRAVDNLDAVVCVDELLGLPAHAFPYIRMVGNLIPEDHQARAGTTIARWGCVLPTIENFEPCAGWTGRDYLVAGLTTGVLHRVGNAIILNRGTGDEVPVGATMDAASAALANDGFCHDLKRALKDVFAQSAQNWLAQGQQHAAAVEGVTATEVEDAGRKLFAFRKWAVGV